MVYLNLANVAQGLGFVQNKNGKEYIRWERVNNYLREFGFPTSGEDTFIPENIFYKLCFKAENEVAIRFQDKVTDEVLPSIRQTGAYMTAETIEKVLYDPDIIIDLAKQLKRLQLENAQKTQLIGELQPKANYVDIILNNKGLVTITQIAKDYGMSGQSMNHILHNLGVQFFQSGQWLLYSKYHNEGYTHSQTIPIEHSNGNKDVKMQTKWTQKGRFFLYNLLKDNGILPLIEQDMEDRVC